MELFGELPWGAFFRVEVSCCSCLLVLIGWIISVLVQIIFNASGLLELVVDMKRVMDRPAPGYCECTPVGGLDPGYCPVLF